MKQVLTILSVLMALLITHVTSAQDQAVPVLHRLRYLLSDSGFDGALLGRRVRRDEDETRAVELVHGDGAEGHVGGAHLLPHLVRVRGCG